ncbi:MAG: 2'-5' RNA ligase family protein [Acidimicrobiales bacterium]
MGEARACAGRWLHPATALVIPTVSVEAALTAWAGRSLRFGGAPLHVTVMYPFLPPGRIDVGVHQGLAELAAGMDSFAYRLDHIGRFPGVYFLAPEPVERFVQLTAGTQARWPSCLPYSGAYDQVTPHMTIGWGEDPPAALDDLAPLLPMAMEASELWLIVQGARGWRTDRRFALGTGRSL